ncbi:MAG: CAP domain-containing protein [Dehalococcoidia bacterium]|nr:MAG: CAP domain-containing protein [Dehalococcoidia bacterium]
MRLVTRTSVSALWALLAVCVLVGLLWSVSSPTASAAVALDPEEQTAINLVNAERTTRGLPALKVSPTLQAAAEWMAADLVVNTTPAILAHTDTLGRGIRERFNAFGYSPNSAIRENLNLGQATAAASITAWMNSPTHRDNNLATDVSVLGLALVVRPGTPYVYYWALAFGSVDDSEPAAPAPTSTATPVVAVTISGSVPTSGVALLQASSSGSAEGIIAGLQSRGCSATSVWLVTSGAMRGYLAGAPAFVNTAFPSSVASGTAFIAVCR